MLVIKVKKKTKLNEEFSKAKELEEKALMAALGYKVINKDNNTLSTRQQLNVENACSSKFKIVKEKEKSSEIKNLKNPESDYLDKMLIKFLNKYGIEKVIDALGGSDKKSKKNKRKEKKSKHQKIKKSKDSKIKDDESFSSYTSSDNDNDDCESSKRKGNSYPNSSSTKRSKPSSSKSYSSSTDAKQH